MIFRDCPSYEDFEYWRMGRMREVLFRAKRADDGNWVKGYYAVKGKGTDFEKHFIVSSIFDSDTSAYPFYFAEIWVNPETVCQYTGYKDDAGKRIFEGDIVCFMDVTSTESGYCEMDCCGKVGYDEEEMCFYVTDRLSAESGEVLGDCHIVGNIFDNPEMMDR